MPRVRIELVSFAAPASRRQGRRDDQADSCDDPLRPATGLVNGVLLSLGVWALIAFLVWLIAR